MIVEIQHETRLRYTEPVSESVAELRMEPLSDADQTCQTFHLALSPAATLFRFQDGFGNRVHHFNLLPPVREIGALAASIVETHPRGMDPAKSAAVYPLETETLPLDVADYLLLRGPIQSTALLKPVLDT